MFVSERSSQGRERSRREAFPRTGPPSFWRTAQTPHPHTCRVLTIFVPPSTTLLRDAWVWLLAFGVPSDTRGSCVLGSRLALGCAPRESAPAPGLAAVPAVWLLGWVRHRPSSVSFSARASCVVHTRRWLRWFGARASRLRVWRGAAALGVSTDSPASLRIRVDSAPGLQRLYGSVLSSVGRLVG